MSKINNVQAYVEAPSGGGTCRQVIDLAMPGDVASPSISIHEGYLKSRTL